GRDRVSGAGCLKTVAADLPFWSFAAVRSRWTARSDDDRSPVRNGISVPMNGTVGKLARCAIYTRKSSEHNLDLAFTSLDAQREACEAYIKSQASEGWRLVSDHYDDGGLSGPRWNGEPCRRSWRMSVPAKSILWWSTKSTVLLA